MLRVLLQGRIGEIGPQPAFALHEDVDFLPTLPYVDCSSMWAHNLQDRVCRQK